MYKNLKTFNSQLSDGHLIGLGLAGPKQNVFIDVFKRFGVTAYGINKAIELARYPAL